MRTPAITCVVLVILMLVAAESQFARPRNETRELQERLQRAEVENERLNRELRSIKSELSNKVDASNSKIDDLKSRLDAGDQKVKDLNEQIGNRIASTETKTDQKLGQLDGSIGRNTAFLIIGGVALAIFSGLIYLLLRRRLHRTETDLADNILQTRKELEEESVKLDNKMIEILTTKMQLTLESVKSVESSDHEIDHSLALKVADEIVRIQRNLDLMDPETRGLKQLAASIRRIHDNFEANGYELANLLGKPYDAGMKVIVANAVPDGNLAEGAQVISRIIRPQVNYKDEMIQAAQVEVSVG